MMTLVRQKSVWDSCQPIIILVLVIILHDSMSIILFDSNASKGLSDYRTYLCIQVLQCFTLNIASQELADDNYYSV